MRRALPPLIACAALVAGCGSTTIRHVTTTITRASSSTTTTATSGGETTARTSTSQTTTASTTTAASAGHANRAASAGSPIAGRSPKTIIKLAARALRHAGGYAMRADLVEDHRRTIIDLSADSTRRYSASTQTGSTTFDLIALSGRAYLRGNDHFWHGESGVSSARAKALAGRWLQVPATGTHSVLKTLGTLRPGTLARCLAEDHGTLRVSGERIVEHRRAVIVSDTGNAPGATPSTLAVAATGTPYPLLWDGTGATRKGGRIDVCNNGKGDGATGTIALSQFGQAPSIEAPTTTGSAPGNPT